MQTICLQRKLASVIALAAEERDALENLVLRVDHVAARKEIIAEGERPHMVHLMVDGWAARRKMLPSGISQYTAFLIPGDFCDIHVNVLARMDHNITALTPCRVAIIDCERLDALTLQNSRLTRGLWWSTLVDEAILREWVVNNGHRKAFEATAHLLCEMHLRLKMVGLANGDDGPFSFPVTQEDLANATGLSSVHTNRILQQLRRERLIKLHSRQLDILDLGRLRHIAGFESDYLHLRHQDVELAGSFPQEPG